MRKLSFLICLALLLPLICVFPSAETYGPATKKLTVTHINEAAYHEGSAIIYTESDDGTIAQYGAFNWWYVASFKWDDAAGCYVTVQASSEMNVAKGAIQIPENGFVYAVNVGNDYPSLGDKTQPNYVNAPTSDSCEMIKQLKAGDKAYLYNIDLHNNIIKNNGAAWYTADFKTDSFIKIGSEESGMTAYNPNGATDKAPEFRFGINAVNTTVQEGQVLLLTPSYGKSIDVKGNNYDWCKVAVFDWNAEAEAYVLVSVDTGLGQGMQKTAVIPPNGFVIAVNLGNNYPALGMPGNNYTNPTSNNVFNNIGSVAVGSKAYLTGIDIRNSTFEYEGDISTYYTSAFTTKGFINFVETKPEGAYEPNNADMLDTPVFKNNKNGAYLKKDIVLAWDAVEGAESYTVTVTNSTINANGASVIAKEISETQITVPESKLTVGATYTARVYASGSGKGSPIGEYTFSIYSERALTSKFRGKKIVAFGDSITAFPGWVSMLKGEFGTEVINAGVGGDRTTHALARIANDVIAQNPDLVFINFGMNDQAIDPATGTNLTPIAEYEANYRNIISQIQATGSEIILVAVHDVCISKYGASTVPYYDRKDASGVTYVDRYNEVVKKLADELNLGFLDINSKAQDILDSISSDGIHLSEEGQKKYCEWISDYAFEFVDAETDWEALPPMEIADDDFASDSSDVDVSEISNEASEAEGEDDGDKKSGGLKTWQLALLICVMFAGISVFGVLFFKTVKKNKKL